MPTRKVSRGKIQFESPHYRVYKNVPHLLYVAPAAISAAPSHLLSKAASIPADPDKYVAYKYRHKFTAEDNDCLRFAEGLALGELHYTKGTCVYTVEGSDRKFGVSDKRNIELARKWRKDEQAARGEGEAYAIVRMDLGKALKDSEEDLPPYHIAHVLLEDGEWRVTLEADAGMDLNKPAFGIYSTETAKKSFHAEYAPMYGEDKAATIVLRHIKTPRLSISKAS